MPERLIVLQPITVEIIQYRKHRHRSTVFIGHVTILNQNSFKTSSDLSYTKLNIFYFFVWKAKTSLRGFKNTDKIIIIKQRV